MELRRTANGVAYYTQRLPSSAAADDASSPVNACVVMTHFTGGNKGEFVAVIEELVYRLGVVGDSTFFRFR